MRRFSYLVLCLLLTIPGAPTPSIQDQALPLVVLLGDSIRLAYAPTVAEALRGRAWVVSAEPNGGDTANLLAHLDEWAILYHPSVVHLNAGLHDLKRDRWTRTLQVDAPRYRANMSRILDRLEARTNAALIVATITPVVEARVQAQMPFDLRNSDIDAFNRLLRSVVEEHPGVQLNDLHAVARRLGPEAALGPDGVHFTDESARILGEHVASEILEVLDSRRPFPRGKVRGIRKRTTLE